MPYSSVCEAKTGVGRMGSLVNLSGESDGDDKVDGEVAGWTAGCSTSHTSEWNYWLNVKEASEARPLDSLQSPQRLPRHRSHATSAVPPPTFPSSRTCQHSIINVVSGLVVTVLRAGSCPPRDVVTGLI